MAVNGLISRRRLSDGSIDGLDLSPSSDLPHEVHVLAVDDSLVDRKVIEKLLKISACKVTAVDSGRRALQFLGLDAEERDSSVVDGLKVDLVITDYCMPGMTGYELLKKIKESSALRETPVVIMSSENVLTRKDRCLEEGAEEFILKPVKLSDVRRLKDYMMLREDRFKDAMDMTVAAGGVVAGVNNKRKSRDDGSEFSSPVSLQSPASPPSSFPLSSNSPPPSSDSLLSSSDSPLSLSPASSDSLLSQIRPSITTSSSAESPSSISGVLDFPTRKIEPTLPDDHEIVPDSKL